jgi:hypothetical protein
MTNNLQTYRGGENGEPPTPADNRFILLDEHKKIVAKLERKIKRLEKRLLEKKKFELGYLINASTTPQLLERIDAKDRAALAD